jgi:hypothetical protein
MVNGGRYLRRKRIFSSHEYKDRCVYRVDKRIHRISRLRGPAMPFRSIRSTLSSATYTPTLQQLAAYFVTSNEV